MESEDRELLRAIDRKVDAIQEESETYVAERTEVLARLEAAVRDRGPALPSGSLRLWLLGGAMALVLSMALLAFTLGQENVRLLLDWLK